MKVFVEWNDNTQSTFSSIGHYSFDYVQSPPRLCLQSADNLVNHYINLTKTKCIAIVKESA